jgi:opacity protein-like surface antigen
MKRFVLLAVLAVAVCARASAQSADVGVDDPSRPVRWFATFSIIAFDPATHDLAEFKRLIRVAGSSSDAR